ncbi:MAG TPA: hypothetical protein VJJ73_01810 [Candidatus Paceibacterota bacterium]
MISLPVLVLEQVINSLTTETMRGTRKWEQYLYSERGIFTRNEAGTIFWIGSRADYYSMHVYSSLECMRDNVATSMGIISRNSRLYAKLGELYELGIATAGDGGEALQSLLKII